MLPALYAQGHRLDCQPAAFGWLTSAIAWIDQPATLRQRLQTDGYLYLPGLLDAAAVRQARQELCGQLAAEGALAADTPATAAIARPDLAMQFRPDLVAASPALRAVLYTGPMLAFYQTLLGGSVRPFDYTWLRAVAPGLGTPPHCDSVYMGRGTPNLYTSWTPLGDVSLTMGGLLVLEGSHRIAALRDRYAQRDVDSYAGDRINARLYASGAKTWSGVLSRNPVTLQRRYGGRWLTQNFRAGDVVVFSIFTVHASLDNQSAQVRLSADSRYQLAAEPADERWVGAAPPGHSLHSRRDRRTPRPPTG